MKARSLKQPYRQLPSQNFLDTDDINDVIVIMRELRRGQLRGAALLCDSIESDDRIKAVQETRIGSLLATPLNLKPGNKKRLARKLADQFGGVDDSPGEWDRMFPPGIIAELCRWGTLLGIGVAELMWDTSGSWFPRLRLWHPQFIRWDWSTFSYKILTADGEIELPRLDENPNGDRRWLMWCPYGYQEGYKHGLIRALARLYIMRGWDYRDWARWNELKGQGIIKAIMPVQENEESDLQFLTDVANRGSEAVIAVHQGAEGNKYDIENVSDSGGSEGWKSFEAFKKALDVDIAVLWLGQNLSTESPSKGSSSKALGEVQRATTLDRLKVDAGIAGAIYDQVIVPMTQMKWGDPDVAPRPVYVTEPPKDQLEEGTAWLAIGQAVLALKNAGIAVDEPAVAESAGIPQKTPEQVAAEKAIADEEAAQKMEAQRDLMAAQGGSDTPPGSNPPPGGATPQPPTDPVKAKKAALRAAIPAAYPRRTFAGLPVAIENAAGTTRVWRDAAGATSGATKMQNDYGFIEGHTGSDGEEMDVYLGPDENAPEVHVVHQLKAPDFKTHDEDKIFMGFASGDAARAAYVAHRNDGDRAIGGMSSMPIDRFKAKLKRRTGTGKVRASAVDMSRATAALTALANCARPGKAALRAKGDVDHADRLAANATRLASRALAPYVTGVRGLMDGLADHKDPFGELQRRLVAYYRKADPSRVADVVARARIMGHLAGQAHVRAE